MGDAMKGLETGEMIFAINRRIVTSYRFYLSTKRVETNMKG